VFFIGSYHCCYNTIVYDNNDAKNRCCNGAFLTDDVEDGPKDEDKDDCGRRTVTMEKIRSTDPSPPTEYASLFQHQHQQQ